MKSHPCDQVREAAMARADGETHLLTDDEVAAHLRECADCRREVEAMQSLASLLNARARCDENLQAWPQIAARLGIQRNDVSSAGLGIFELALCLILLADQAALYVLPGSLHWPVRLVGLWTWHRVNPFVIKPQLVSAQTSHQ